MAKYAEAESHTCRSSTPRRTSDHVNDSASGVKELFVLAKLYYAVGRKSLPFYGSGAIKHQPFPSEFLFLCSQERCGLQAIWKDEETKHSTDKCLSESQTKFLF